MIFHQSIAFDLPLSAKKTNNSPMDISKIRRQRLLKLLSERYTADKDFLIATGMHQSQLTQIKKGKQPNTDDGRNIGEKLARKIELAIGLDIGWLDTVNEDGNVSVLPFVGKMTAIPEVSWVQAGPWNDSPDNSPVGQGERMHYTHLPVSKGTYALRVKGDSMLAPIGVVPTYPEGFVIYVDPSIDPIHGADVIFRMPGASEATFKRLSIEGSQTYLKPLNPSYSVIEIDESYEYCGTVVHVGMDVM